MKIHIETYGCSANLNNAEIMKGILSKKHKIVNSENDADVIVLNTCIVKGPTENRMIERIRKIKKQLIVGGCMPNVYWEKIKSLNKNAILVGINDIKNIGRAIEEQRSFISKEREIKLSIKKINQNKLIDIIQISEGCLGNCSYCITKLAKGNLFSYPEEAILKQIKKTKCKEIWLTSQDNSCYGLERKTNLVNLLKKIVKIKKDFKIRIGMMNPNHLLKMLDDLIKVYASEKIYKFLHIPLQSGNDEILKRMHRGYKVSDFEKIIRAFRKRFPEIHIMTDIICGFPGETDEQFNDSLEIIKKIRPDSVHINRFWPMEKTEAAKMKQLPAELISKRAKIMHELVKDISLNKNKEWIKWKGNVLINEGERGNWKGRNYCYKQVVVDSRHSLKKDLFGKEVNVEIIDAGVHHLKGTIIS